MIRFLHERDIDWRETVKTINPALAYLPASVSTAQTLAVYGKTAEAEQIYQQLLADNDNEPSVLRAYAGLLQRFGRNADSQDLRRRAHIEEVSRLGLDDASANEVLQFRLAIEGLADAPAAAPAEYVAARFDAYAESFDEHLTATLRYRTPDHLMTAIHQIAGDTPRLGTIFDGGCGTGLMGDRLRPFADRLDGCDLSPGMIEEAKRKAIYDDVFVADVAAVLKAREGFYDWLVIADVFPYVGDLRAIVSAVTLASKSPAFYAFSTEVYDGDGYHLHAQGRYSHGEGYLRTLAEEFNWRVVFHARETLRYQLDQPVAGHIMVWAR